MSHCLRNLNLMIFHEFAAFILLIPSECINPHLFVSNQSKAPKLLIISQESTCNLHLNNKSKTLSKLRNQKLKKLYDGQICDFFC